MLKYTTDTCNNVHRGRLRHLPLIANSPLNKIGLPHYAGKPNKALEDSNISAEEFSLILKEKEKYIILKNSIRKKLRETIDSKVEVETLKKSLEEGLMIKLKKSNNK